MSEKPSTAEWVPVSKYIQSGKCPIDLRWLIFHRKGEMLESSCLLKIGKRLAIDHSRLMLFLENLSDRGESIKPKEIA